MGFEHVQDYFVHFFNIVENQRDVGPVPGVEYYGVAWMLGKSVAFLKQ